MLSIAHAPANAEAAVGSCLFMFHLPCRRVASYIWHAASCALSRLQDRMREALRIELRQEFVDKIESLEAQLIASKGSFDEYRLTLQVTHSGSDPNH